MRYQSSHTPAERARITAERLQNNCVWASYDPVRDMMGVGAAIVAGFVVAVFVVVVL